MGSVALLRSWVIPPGGRQNLPESCLKVATCSAQCSTWLSEGLTNENSFPITMKSPQSGSFMLTSLPSFLSPFLPFSLPPSPLPLPPSLPSFLPCFLPSQMWRPMLDAGLVYKDLSRTRAGPEPSQSGEGVRDGKKESLGS